LDYNLFSASEHSPYILASSVPIASLRCGPQQFSPLSLQPEMHNSPSSGGQSSSEGLADATGQGSELGHQQTQRQQSAAEPSAASIILAVLKQLVRF
jgi:hypothetical protein